ncbi:MAG: hypothetical protein AB9873_18760 [Syntrophobacteraceae bacterium]
MAHLVSAYGGNCLVDSHNVCPESLGIHWREVFFETMTIDRHQGAGELSYTNINCSRNRCYDVLVNLLISLPILSAIINALSWLRFGVDLPLLDDWRNWNFGLTGSFDLKHLFVPAKGTLDPIGLALDSLATRSLNGNTIAYQFLSMVTVLSSVLWLQWHLLSVALKDRLLTASAFSFTLFMLQPGSYWGLQNLAYHQAIPVVCNLSAINLFTGEKWNDWKIPIVLMLGIISGMTCISGTLSILAIGAASLILSRFIKGSDQKPLVRGGLSLLITGVITSIPQAWVTAVFRKLRIDRTSPWLLPSELISGSISSVNSESLSCSLNITLSCP